MPKDLPSTPLMRQYHAIKEQVPGALLLFHLGDFYELFYDDAIVASRDLQITLTSRNKEKGDPVPMCGVPVRAADGYIAKLIEKGHRVAVCEQVEDASKTKTIVRREVTRIVTPGTASDLNLLDSGKNNYLAAVVERKDRAGLAYVDVSTGDFRMTEVALEDVEATLETLGVRELLAPSAGPLFPAAKTNGSHRRLRTEVEPWTFDFDYGQRLLLDHYRLHSLDGLGAAGSHAAISAAGALLHYLRDTQKSALTHLDRPSFYRRQEWMALDPVTCRNLELVEPLFGGSPKSTLLHSIDQTATAMGARLLRQWLLRPALDLDEIEARLGGVEELAAQTITRTEIRRELGSVLDIERLLARVTLGSATPRDVRSLGDSLRCLPMLRGLVRQLKSARMLGLLARMEELADVRDRIVNTISETPPMAISEGGVIAKGVDAELDELREISRSSRGFIARLEAEERKRTGIGSLKVKHNNVFGFYIEVSKANLDKVPENYDRKQTLVNAERFITPELKEYEGKVFDAEERIQAKERALFDEVRTATAAEGQRVKATAAAIAELDALHGLALTAAERDYVRPSFSSSGEIQICAGRHPVIERLADEEGVDRFIPNDVYLNDTDHLVALITGPNMGGKSTYLRQIAQIAILAQMGSFVPARKATLPVLDRVFTRIGASDNLAQGRSTFMVEMTETSQILNTATPRSLILLDEIGRGTSTFDGLAIAWAVVEHIHHKTRAKTLFATHYHELTELAELLDGVFNLHVTVRESGEKVTFLRKVETGKADRSYGIEVARLAGLPPQVVERARAVLKTHERKETAVTEELSAPLEPQPLQVSIFPGGSGGVLAELESLNLDEMKPIEALSLLHEWKAKLKGAA
jgi:DNA mismatch repair protein MutS